jgi:hypothetical protein
MAKHLKYWTLVVIISFGVTIGVHYLFRPLWFSNTGDHSHLSIVETSFTVVLLPVILLIVNYRLTKKFAIKTSFIINAIIILSCVVIATGLQFRNWADSVGSSTHPGEETLKGVTRERTVALIVAAIGILLTYFKLSKERRLERKYYGHRSTRG